MKLAEFLPRFVDQPHRLFSFAANLSLQLRSAPLLLALLGLNTPVLATPGAVASAHPLATTAGIAMFKQGGNAIDAAVATAFVLGVVEPSGSGIGGGGFALVYSARAHRTRVLDFREVAPRAAKPSLYIDASGKPSLTRSQEGILAGGVPGEVRGLVRLQKSYGRLRLGQVLAPAIGLAAQGFAVSARLHEQLLNQRNRLTQQAALAAIWYPQGITPLPGDILKQPDLARTMQAIAQTQGESFYTGKTSRLWLKFQQTEKGLVTAADLKSYQPLWREPLSGQYRGLTVLSMPPPSSGGVHLLQMLNMFSGQNLAAMTDADRTEFMAEAMKRAYADRSRFLGDPAFVPVPVNALLTPTYAQKLAATINSKPTPSAEITPGALLDPKILAQFRTWEQKQHESLQTSHLSTMDALGNAVSLTQTINGSFGAGVVVPGTGVLLNNEMDDFSLAPNTPNLFGLVGDVANAIAPNKRPLSSMTPTLVFKNGKPWLAVGSPGGAFIITAVLQTIVNVIDLQFPLDKAVATPRFHHQWLPDQLFVETGLAREVTTDLSNRGYTLKFLPAMGNVQAVMFDANKFTAVADPRREGTGQIWQ